MTLCNGMLVAIVESIFIEKDKKQRTIYGFVILSIVVGMAITCVFANVSR
jgi:NAD/NADP transhydrogenase beta subunit